MLKVRIARVSSTYTSKSGLQSSHSAASTYPSKSRMDYTRIPSITHIAMAGHPALASTVSQREPLLDAEHTHSWPPSAVRLMSHALRSNLSR